MPLTSADGGSRSSRWMWAVPRKRPVGVACGGRTTNTCAAMAGDSSGLRTRASASATVASGSSTTGSEVIRPPAVWSA